MPNNNEAPRSELRGIKAEFAETNPPSLFKPFGRELRAEGLRRVVFKLERI